MKVTARKALSAAQKNLVQDVCDQRGIVCSIIEHKGWINIKMTGEQEDVAAAWAHIIAGRNEA